MKYKTFLIFSLLVAACLSLVPQQSALAEVGNLGIDTGCSGETGLRSYTGRLELAAKSYDVYVRLAKRGDVADVKAYTQRSTQDYGICDQLGSLTASGDKWTKLGSLTVAQRQDYVLELASPSLANLPDANRPSLMLVPGDRSVCIPDSECEVTIDGQKGIVRPTGTRLDYDSLHVLNVVDPSKDSVKTVRYYVDHTLVYSTATLQPFDLRYVSNAGQKTDRIIEYQSGQKILLQTTTPTSHTDTFENFLFRLSTVSPVIFSTVVWVIGVLLIVTIILVIIHIVQRHRDWEYHHGFIYKERHELTPEQLNFIEKKQQAFKIVKLGLIGSVTVFGVLAAIVVTDNFVAQVFTVNGRSMRNTLVTGDKMLLNKLPRTLANIGGLEYVPKRGDVVIARAVFGATALSDDSEADTYIIKRVIGLPGERIVVENGKVTVYNKERPEGFNPDAGSSWEKSMVSNLKTEHFDIQLSTSELFLSGDNRPESIDSRFNGPIATKEVVGHAGIRLWPLGATHTEQEE